MVSSCCIHEWWGYHHDSSEWNLSRYGLRKTYPQKPHLRGGLTGCQSHVGCLRSYAIGENDAGMSIFVCWLTGLSPLWGGQTDVFRACSRMRCRDARSAYGQICIQRFSPPTSLVIQPAIGESLTRSGRAFSQASSTFGMAPGAYV